MRKNRFAKTVAAALTFGLVAGGTMTGVTYTANQLLGTSAAAEASAETAAEDTTSSDTVTLHKASYTSASDSSRKVAQTESGNEGELTVAQVAENVMPSMVTISVQSVQEVRSFYGGSQEYQVEGAGTGVIVGETDEAILIATNDHVISGATNVSVGFVDETVAEAAVKGTDTQNDLAVLMVQKENISEDTLGKIRVATIGDSDSLALGQQVVAIGNALGYGQSVTSGYISALNRDLQMSGYNSTGLIQTDAAINSGNSGGALLNMKGELIGINEAKSSSSGSGEATVDNMGFAIPMAKAEPILQELMNKEVRTKLSDEERGYLGVNVADVSSEYSQIYGMPEGVCITYVQENGAAENAGLLKGDIIVKLNGYSVVTREALIQELSGYASGEKVTLTVMRADNGEYNEKEIEVTLESKDSMTDTNSDSSRDTDSGRNADTDNSSNTDIDSRNADTEDRDTEGGNVEDWFRSFMNDR
ncbi:MAG: trypsin-like peptidase domain-containing protein [Eubacteriales bacterium]|nr:trypsin-like peptidase domain-containing protein [Eubacteriales bacterium]